METVTGLFYFTVIGFIYFLPSLAARGKSSFGSVFVVNLFLGWTIIGWIIALAIGVNGEVEK